jgi:hypothetical protein
MVNQNPDIHMLNRARMCQRYQLSDAVLTVAVDEWVFSLHRRSIDSNLWSIQTHAHGGVTVAGGGPLMIATADIGERRVIYGMLPPAVSTVRITTNASHPIEAIEALVSEGLFCALTPLFTFALVTFYDADGCARHVQPLLDPDVIPARQPCRARWWAWLRRWLVSAVSVRDACTYHSRSHRRRQ